MIHDRRLQKENYEFISLPTQGYRILINIKELDQIAWKGILPL